MQDTLCFAAGVIFVKVELKVKLIHEIDTWLFIVQDIKANTEEIFSDKKTNKTI
jgi:hypothetical protein